MEHKMSLDEIRKIVVEQYPEYIIVPSSDYENESNESYKYLYENTYIQLTKYQEELFNIDSERKNLEKEYYDLKVKYDEIKKYLSDSVASSNDLSEKQLNDDVFISNVEAKDSEGNIIKTNSFKIFDANELSNNPGVYEFKRPSWFTPLQNEMNRQNIVYKNVDNTKDSLVSRLISLKKISLKNFVRKASSEYDQERKQNISKILMSTEISNEEKYLRYILITPGLSDDFRDILFSASELGLDANVIIELLEQPKESFNKEVIEAFVSKVRKGTEYNLKQELAEELVKGQWYISVMENNVQKKLQLIPIDDLVDMKKKIENLENLRNIPENNARIDDFDESVNIAEYPDVYDNMSESDSSMINFDDSMI